MVAEREEVDHHFSFETEVQVFRGGLGVLVFSEQLLAQFSLRVGYIHRPVQLEFH